MGSLLPLTKPPEKICILRLSALGDVTHVVPVIRAIQSAWPETEITWICGTFETKLVEHIDGVRLIRFDKKAGWRSYRSLWKELKDIRFDVLLHMQVSARANLASMGIKAKIRLGWDSMRSRDLHGLFINHRVPVAHKQHQVLAFLSFARALGINVTRPEWDFPVLDSANSFVSDHLDLDKKTLVISPCSSHALRNWTVAGYAAIADYAAAEYQLQVVLCGGPSQLEISTAADIETRVTHPLINLVGKDTLQQLVALLKAADIVISPDAGPMHLANALGTPVIGLHACTKSIRSGPFNSLDYCVDCFEQAALEFLHKQPDDLRWDAKIEQPGVMELISIDPVKAALDRVMSKS